MLIYDLQDVSDEELNSKEYRQKLFEELQIANKNIYSTHPITMVDINELVDEEIENRRV